MNDCQLCETPLSELEPAEYVRNGMHSFCLLQSVAGHVVGACWCQKEMDGKSLREIAIISAERFKMDEFHLRYRYAAE